ncbi:LOG family protein [Fimbriiglobus ruber]|uniref:AMP nucleosidase n=1 Tax=Fimbriiglobus ruber TaxID=1908690 RepID=A0A225DQS4_9BACT|nr:LOG family protein [Fimbriiglobus ruber]OWK38527.1 cytochrome D ubiquinol oxidase subunit II [Fimbriiglobus ruber]
MTPKPAPGTPYDSIHEPDPPDPAAPPAGDPGIDQFVQQIRETADKLVNDRAGRGDTKLLATALKELRYCFKVFAAYRGRRKVTVFGSARTKADHPAFRAAVAFGKEIAARGYMVITGAAAGIMEAGHVGAGRDNSFGLNILLPFEQSANPVIHGDPKLMNMRYFFTRKLMLIKESDAVVLFPGGFGTHDEACEALTLIQTGKTHLFPIVMIDEPGGTYWTRWDQFVRDELLARGYISPSDLFLYRVTDSVEEAVAEVTGFYRVYHSMRYVRGNLVLRLQHRVPPAALDRIRADFKDIAVSGTFEQTDMLPPEANEPTLAHLPRLVFRFDRHNHGRLRQLIDFINREG